jgi:SAM-dependent methyltransferase
MRRVSADIDTQDTSQTMSEWGAGYVDEIAYTYGYCDELNPLRLKLALLDAGLALPAVHTACELGFGHGISVNLHAAGSTVQWYGNDFNVSQTNFARQLADCASSQACLSLERFEEFCARDDLPDFDYIGMHGIWSWISDENRAVIVDFIGRKLKAGGVLYLSYNTQPGWAAMLPLRELMYRHFQLDPGQAAAAPDLPDPVAPERMASRIGAAVAFAKTVCAAQPGYALANPWLAGRVDGLASDSVVYLAHEYFNRDWQPMSFGQVAATLAEAGLAYAGPAHYCDHVDALNLSPGHMRLLAAIPDLVLRETTRDFCVNQAFRRDYWVKHPRQLNESERCAALREQRVTLALPRAAVVLKASGALGEANLPPAIYEPILDALAHYRPETLQHIETCVSDRGIQLAHIVKAVMLLIGAGVLLNAQDDATIQAARPVAARLNAGICELARNHGDVQFLASPVSGSGIRVPRVPQLLLLARLHHLRQPVQWAEFAHAALTASTAGCQASHAPGPDLAELIAQAHHFAEVQLPILQALSVA